MRTPFLLTSETTVFWKCVFPLFMIGAPLIVAVISFAMLRPGGIIAILLCIAATMFALRFMIPLKWVMCYDDHLEVGNYRHVISVSYTEIDALDEACMHNWKLTRLRFSEPTRFGESIIYIPWFHLRFWEEHPGNVFILKKIRSLAEQRRSSDNCIASSEAF